MKLFDSHTHYTDKAFDTDRDELLGRLPQAGVVRCMLCSTNLADARETAALVERFPKLLVGAVGVHPETPDVEKDWLCQLGELAARDGVRAIGEIGLDYHYESYDKEQQQKILRAQLGLARDLDLPVILHCREATADMLALLREFAPLKGVMHCFSGSAETAREVLGMGLMVGFTGVITFRNAKKPLEALRAVPPDKLLLETDCPYLAPVPFRGRRCDSTMLVETARVMAREKELSTEEICRQTAENAERLFGCEET